jgi:hypothetical protein
LADIDADLRAAQFWTSDAIPNVKRLRADLVADEPLVPFEDSSDHKAECGSGGGRRCPARR